MEVIVLGCKPLKDRKLFCVLGSTWCMALLSDWERNQSRPGSSQAGGHSPTQHHSEPLGKRDTSCRTMKPVQQIARAPSPKKWKDWWVERAPTGWPGHTVHTPLPASLSIFLPSTHPISSLWRPTEWAELGSRVQWRIKQT